MKKVVLLKVCYHCIAVILILFMAISLTTVAQDKPISKKDDKERLEKSTSVKDETKIPLKKSDMQDPKKYEIPLIQNQNGITDAAADYTFSYSTGTYTEITGGTVSTAVGDDAVESISLPFTFTYDGTDYTTGFICTNGWLEMGQTYIYAQFMNILESTIYKPFLCPLWDDLYSRGAPDNTEIMYKTTGTYPNRTFIVQWKNTCWSNSGSTVNFQVKLKENGNVIEFHYGTNNSTESRSASIGINDATGGSGHFISVTPGSPPTTSTTTANNSISSGDYPGNGVIYTFTPPSGPIPSAQTETNITTTSAGLGWTENGTATTWDIELGPTEFTPTGTPTANDVTANPYTYGSLSASTTYDWYVRSDYGSWQGEWVGPSTFTTRSLVDSYPYIQNLDDFTICGTISCTNGTCTLSEGWSNPTSGDDFDWTTDADGTPNSGTGPSGDHTSGSGNYLYTESSSCYSYKTAYLLSPCFDLTSLTNPKLSFWYHMRDDYWWKMGTMSVQASTDFGSTWSSDLWSKQYNQGLYWLNATIDLSSYTSATHLILRWTGLTGTSWTSDMAVDDITIFELVDSYPYTQNFDDFTTCGTNCSNGTCTLSKGWGNPTSGDDFDWTTDANGTPNNNTGPSGDHTSGSGNYLYTEASGCFPSKTAYLLSPCFDLTSLTNPKLSFWYHMWAYYDYMGTMSVQASTDYGITWSSNLWSKTGNQGNNWYKEILDLSSYSSTTHLMLRWTGTTGPHTTNGYYGDMAIDDVSIVQLLSGNYDIGSGQTYTSIADAISDLNTFEVSGATTFYLRDATYSESPMTINSIAGASAANTITFKPYSGVTPTITITAASDDAGFELNGADYITFDGSNTSDARDMTIIMAGTNSRGFELRGGASNNTITNCVIEGYSNSSSANYGIYVWGEDNDNNTFENNEIYKFYYGIFLNGTSNDDNTGNAIKDNEIGSSTAASYIGRYGISCSYQTNSEISGNEIYNIIGNTLPYGINFAFSNNSTISKNTIHDIVCTGTFGGSGTGIYIVISETTNANVTIDNNFIYHIAGDGNAPYYCPTGICVWFTTSGLSIYYNSIYLTPDATYGLGNYENNIWAASIFVYAGSGIDMRNNLLRTSLGERTGCTQTTYGYGVYCYGTTSPFTTIDYNDYYITGQDNNNIGYGNNTNYTDLTGWQGFTGQDGHSKNFIPDYTSTTDLHLNLSVANPDYIGTPISGITTDIDGNTRSTTYPYMGGSEGSYPLPVELISFNATVNKNDVTLNWTTAWEVNNAGFDVERQSLEVEKDIWTKIGFVEGKGTTNEPTYYTFPDRKLNTGKYNYRLVQRDYNNRSVEHFLSDEVTVGVPKKYALSQNYPNPFNPITKIDYDLPYNGKVNLVMYDITGRKIATIVNEVHTAGYYTTEFNASHLASGVYFYRIIAKGGKNDFIMTKKMLMIK